MTNTEYQQIVKNWENFIYKTALKYTNINKFDQMQLDDLVQEGYIAVYDAYQSYLTNGKTGNDANGLIKLYIEGRIKTFCSRSTLVRIPRTETNPFKEKLETTETIENSFEDDNHYQIDDNDYWQIYYAKEFINNQLENNLNVQLFVRYVGWDNTEKLEMNQLIEWVKTTHNKNYNNYNIHTAVYNTKRSIRAYIKNKIKERNTPKPKQETRQEPIQIEKPKYKISKITKSKPIKNNWVNYFEKTLK